jgi:two-component system response regulator ResD
MNKPLALIIENDLRSAQMLAMILHTAQYQYEVIEQGDLALERLAAISPTLVILDLHIPMVSGEVILQQIRANVRLAQTKVIIVSADMLLAEKLRHQADFVLTKPFSPKQLHNLVIGLHPVSIQQF